MKLISILVALSAMSVMLAGCPSDDAEGTGDGDAVTSSTDTDGGDMGGDDMDGDDHDDDDGDDHADDDGGDEEGE